MISLLVPMSGTDETGATFSKTIGETVSLDAKSEANYIKEGMATKATQKKEKAKK